MKTFKDLTEKEIDKILHSDMCDEYMYLGTKIVRHCDTSLTLCDLFTIDGETTIFDNESEVEETIKTKFLKDTKERWENRNLKRCFAVGHYDTQTHKLNYEEGLHGIGQSFGYWSTAHVERAWWFNSMQELCEFLDKYCYRDKCVIIDVPTKWIYEKLTGRYLI